MRHKFFFHELGGLIKPVKCFSFQRRQRKEAKKEKGKEREEGEERVNIFTS